MAQNPFTDMFKNFTDVSKFPQVDFGSSMASMKRNVEAASAANQALVEGIHAASRRTAEIVRENAETSLKASRDFMTSGKPDMNLTKQAAYVKDAFESNLSNAREVCEMLFKSSSEAFDVLSKRAAETMEEMTDHATTVVKKAKKAA